MFTKKGILAFFITTLFGLLIYIFISSNQYDSGSSVGIDDINNENQSFLKIQGGNPILNEKRIYFNNAFYLIIFVSIDLIMITFNLILKKNIKKWIENKK